MGDAKRKCAECNRTKARHLWLAKEYKKKGDAVCKSCYKRGPGHRTDRDRYLRRVYGISHDEYLVLLAAQQGRCAICRKKPGRRLLAVDHDHAIETAEGTRASIRGLLCQPCNEFLGHIGDDVSKGNNINYYLVNGVVHTRQLIG